MLAPEAVSVLRVIGDPAALDALTWPAGAMVVRTAPDGLMAIADDHPAVTDPHAIVFEDTAWFRFSGSMETGRAVHEAHATWPPPETGTAQGAVAGIGVKLVVGPERWTYLVPAAYADEFAERIGPTEHHGRASA